MDRLADRPGRRLEQPLHLVVGVSRTHLHMQIAPGAVGERLEEVLDHLGGEGSDILPGDRDVIGERRTVGKIQGDFAFTSSIVSTSNPYRLIPASPQCTAKRFTQGDADILHRMVLVDHQIPVGMEGKITPAVPPDLIEHMVEGDVGMDLPESSSIQREAEGY